jgi:hypothetical protein
MSRAAADGYDRPMRKLACGLAVPALLALGGCRSDLLKEPDLGRAGALAARLEVIEGASCPGLASVATAPTHCAWPSTPSRSLIESMVFRVVAHVDAEGRASSVDVVDGPFGFDADGAACAMRMTYRPALDEGQAPVAGSSCPVSFRLARYVTDINPPDRDPIPCPPVRSPFFQHREWPGTCDP